MPQPVDLQTEMGRVTQAERVQQVQDRASLAAQQRLAASAQETRLQTETQVQESHTTSDQVEKEARRRNPYIGRRRKRNAETGAGSDTSEKPPNAGEKPVIADDSEGITLDVTV
ncbi:MAG: hypothetical protein HZB26_03105 [Candidatus Hydrogenedentes bacterium]|nr:hypothetical protein [Candidatus Hydrogenedentota bacterium]